VCGNPSAADRLLDLPESNHMQQQHGMHMERQNQYMC